MVTKKEKAKKRIRNSVFGIYLVASLILFYFLYTDTVSQEALFKSQLAVKNEKVDSIQGVKELQQKIINTDNQYIRSEYKKAKEIYQDLLSEVAEGDPNYENIKQRIDRINQIENNKDSLLSNIEDYQYSLRIARENEVALNSRLDSLAQIHEEEKAALSEKYDAAKEKIAEKDRQLDKKDNVQVISFRNNKGNLIHYLGEVSNGKAEGGGVGIFDTGGIYRGEWKDNQRHGEGTYEWKDGHKYEGEFVNGTREGQGIYYWSSGEKYEGEWKNGKRNGQGTLYDRDNNIQYEGKWIDDKVQK